MSIQYVVNAFPYLGTDDPRPEGERLGDSVVMRLMEPYLKKGRNLTTDNFFTSLKLAKQLLSKKTSLVGTVNKVRRELPASCLDMQPDLYSTTLSSPEGITLTTYRCEKNKNVVMLSTLHPSVTIAANEKKLPETVAFYISTEYGVDIVDQMARKYSMKASCSRWPIHVFYNILDLAAINAWVLFKESTGKTISRKQFILQLAEELRKPFLLERPRPSRTLTALADDEGSYSSDSMKRRHCQVARCKGNKAFVSCASCGKAVCGKCTASVKNVIFVYFVTNQELSYNFLWIYIPISDSNLLHCFKTFLCTYYR